MPAKGFVELVASFAPEQERDINYTVFCAVKRKPTPLSLNVKAVAYAIHDSLQLEESSGQVGPGRVLRLLYAGHHAGVCRASCCCMQDIMASP